MKTTIYLTGFFARKRFWSGSAILLTVLAALLVLAGFLAMVPTIEGRATSYGRMEGGAPVVFPVRTIDRGSVHQQVWGITDDVYLHNYPTIGGALLPLRSAALWALVILPFVGLFLSACEVSRELETGVAQTLYGAPVSRSVLGISRLLGDSLAVAALISLGILAALAVGSLVVGYAIPGVHLARSAVFVLILGFYTSIFVQAGNLISALSRRSAPSLWICVIVGLCMAGSYFTGDNLMNARNGSYSSIPFPPFAVNRQLSERDAQVIAAKSDEELEEMVGPEFAEYQLELTAHINQTHDRLRADYQRERWYALISPIHAIWEVAQQLLQDRHNASTEIFAPLAAMDPPPSIRRSLAEAWPELAGMLFVWLALFAINVRVLSRLEV